MNRQPIKAGMTIEQVFRLIAEDNAEAEIVLFQLPLMTILDLDAMQMRGAQVVAAFKHCKEDVAAFIKACLDRDKSMVEAVNRQTAALGLQAYTGSMEANETSKAKRNTEQRRPAHAGFARGARVRR